MLISIVTPTLDEATTLPARAAELARQGGPWEWVVVDGGSGDGTAAIARGLGAQVLRAPRGRGPQLNAGAAAARGEALLFLHADTRLPDGALEALRAALADPAIVGGNFELRFEGHDLTARLFTRYYYLQRHWLRVYAGDSGIWVRRAVFERLGGFPDYPIMEDLDFACRLERAGRTACLAPALETSARRYRGRVVRTVVTWATICALFALGVPASALGRLYPPRR